MASKQRYETDRGSRLNQIHWAKRWERQDQQLQPHKSAPLPLPTFPPALAFDIDAYISSYQRSGDLEKATIRPSRPVQSYRSNASTLSDTTSSFELPKHKSSQLTPLPPKRYPRLLRRLRYTLLTVYRRLFTTIFLINFVIAIVLRSHTPRSLNPNTLATAASTNFVIAILIRQDFIVNLIFRTAWLVPWSFPLRIRRIVARCYTFGGIHSGAAVAGTLWFLGFSAGLTVKFAEERKYTLPVIVVSWGILLLLVVILVLAYPNLRSRYHNTFELTHRFLGWGSILLFWIQILLFTHLQTTLSTTEPFAKLLFCNSTFWNLAIMTGLLIYPWTRLRKVHFTPELLSSHAVRLNTSLRLPKFSCLSIATHPLGEWHPFATFPSSSLSTNPHTSAPTPPTSMIISDAGDWTHTLIQRAQAHHLGRTQTTPPPEKNATRDANTLTLPFYTKLTPKSGVLSLSLLFPRVILLTTGSGIGPALSSLLDRPASQFARLIWSTRSPLTTFGAELYAQVMAADVDAVVLDTTAMGRPDLVEVAWRVYREVGAEAVFVLSNERVTRRVVYALEGRGVPAFGPVWDS